MSGIVGTAGHIDHGKTTLVAALTGIETDRLPEEKRRGITIALGFAPLPLEDGMAGLVDVPGHEKFVRTMVAGAVGIDVVLLVVAADEGVMPQTREHLEICALLGVPRGVVALTKLDKAGEELSELARADVEETLEGTFLEGAPIISCSAKTGEGLPALKEALSKSLDALPRRREGARFFLPADRVLSVPGFGTVVTGTALSGRLERGATVEIGPAPHGRNPVARVRSVQEFGADAECVLAGHRAALALSGVDGDEVKVGQALFAPGAARPTQRLSVQLRHLASRTKPLPSGAKVMLHLGTRAVEAGLTLFGTDEIGPGEEGFATARLREPVLCLPGQRFILRGHDAPGWAGRTVGGGMVLDPEPPRRRRRDPLVRACLRALAAFHVEPDSTEAMAAALAGLIAEGGPRGLETSTLARRLGVTESRAERAAQKTKDVLRIASEEVWLAADVLAALEPEVIEAVERFHHEQPLAPGVSGAEVATRVGGRPGIVERTWRKLVRQGELELVEAHLRRRGFVPPRDQTETRDQILRALHDGGLEPPGATELSATVAADPKVVKTALGALSRDGHIVHLGKGLYFETRRYQAAETALCRLLSQESEVTTAQAKSLFGISRKFLIPLLESFDKRGVTTFEDGARRLGSRAGKPS